MKITATEGERSVDGGIRYIGALPPQAAQRRLARTASVAGVPASRLSAGRDCATPQLIDGELFVVRMKPVPAPAAAPSSVHEIAVKDVRIRYAEKTSSAVNVGSAAKTFTVPNIGNVPCGNKPPCSPDGKWKASVGGITMDAGEGQQFDNARVSCIARPVPVYQDRNRRHSSPRPHHYGDGAQLVRHRDVSRGSRSDSRPCRATPFAKPIPPSMAAP